VFADLALGADVGRSTNAAADLDPGAARDDGQRAAKHRAVEARPAAERRHEAQRAR
jgi:hypothetical protein